MTLKKHLPTVVMFLDAVFIAASLLILAPNLPPVALLWLLPCAWVSFRFWGLHCWRSAQRTSTWVSAILFSAAAVSLATIALFPLFSWQKPAILPLFGLILMGSGFSRVVARRIATSLSVPVWVVGKGPVSRGRAEAMDRALCPRYKCLGFLSHNPQPGELMGRPIRTFAEGRETCASLASGDVVEDNGSAVVDDGDLPFVETPTEGMSYRVKRSYDLLLSLPLSVVLLPLLALVAILLRLTQGPPVFYAQVRLGAHGKPFQIYKLRTMRIDAEPGGDAVWPQSSDDRITAVGRILRQFWVDEWPQLLNVLKGDMSLIGPRPERPVFIKEFSMYLPKYNERLEAPCGVTGLAQAMGFAGNTSLRKRLLMDRLYILKWSPLFDLTVLLLTARHLVDRSQRQSYSYIPGEGQRVP